MVGEREGWCFRNLIAGHSTTLDFYHVFNSPSTKAVQVRSAGCGWVVWRAGGTSAGGTADVAADPRTGSVDAQKANRHVCFLPPLPTLCAPAPLLRTGAACGSCQRVQGVPADSPGGEGPAGALAGELPGAQGARVWLAGRLQLLWQTQQTDEPGTLCMRWGAVGTQWRAADALV